MQSNPILDHLYEGSPLFEILSWLLVSEDSDHPKSEIASCARVSRSYLDLVLPLLIDNGLVTHTRTIGRSKMFRIALPRKELSDRLSELSGTYWVID